MPTNSHPIRYLHYLESFKYPGYGPAWNSEEHWSFILESAIRTLIENSDDR
jgi:hypothetical protein